jgi:hypothetical protein
LIKVAAVAAAKLLSKIAWKESMGTAALSKKQINPRLLFEGNF